MTTAPRTRVKRVDTLTDAQRATFAPYAAEWIARGQKTGCLTEPEWQEVEAAIRRCYGYAGLPAPKVIVRVPSPIVGALAAPIAALLIEIHRRGAVGDAVAGAVRGAVDDAVAGAVDGAVAGAVRGAVDDAVLRRAVADVLDNARYRRFGGQHWSGWMAWRIWFRDHGGLDLDGDLWDRAQAYADASAIFMSPSRSSAIAFWKASLGWWPR